jgi:hypothetical protein
MIRWAKLLYRGIKSWAAPRRQPADPGKVDVSLETMRPTIGNETERTSELLSALKMERIPVPNVIHISHAVAHPDDELERAFPGCTLSHILTVSTHDQLSIALEALHAVRTAGGGLDALHLTRRGERLEHQLKISGLRPHQARSLCNRLAALPGVERATIEHQILKAGSTSASIR